jgi:adenylosuccinate lyase
MENELTSQAPELHALSSLDGRYARTVEPLKNYFSEFAFFRQRVHVEIEYLIALSRDAHLVRPLSDAEENCLRALALEFSTQDALEIKRLERTTRHDVKAIEYFLRSKLESKSLADVVEWLHFGLTSEDVNQMSQALALRDSLSFVLFPALQAIIGHLSTLARQYKSTPMLARTHGQPAVPTTLGKEFAVFLSRLKKQRTVLRAHRFEAKLAGAVGNNNALVAAAPQVEWLAFGDAFIRSMGLEPTFVVTQLMPYDNWIRYFDMLRLTNSMLIDLAQDMWRYVSDDYLVLKVEAGEVGSSTMPQKVNPIDFENAEGNLGLANALLGHYAQKLAGTRLQRDLSDSTVRRTFGVALGHTLLAFSNMARGLESIRANEPKLRDDLDAHWEVIAEGAQTILRTAGLSNAYDELKQLTRGKSITRSDIKTWIDSLAVNDSTKARLRELTPHNYVGLAEQIVERTLSDE